MRKRFFLLPALVAQLIALSCTTTQHVAMPPVTIHANAPQAFVYQESYPIKTAIRHTALDLSFDWEQAQVLGKATLTLQPHFYPQDTVVLDANGFEIHEIALMKSDQKKRLDFVYDGKKLRVALDRAYDRTEQIKIFIDYTAKPNDLEVGTDIASPDDRGLYFIEPDTAGTPRQLWTQGETECNSSWFPTMNNTMLKMTQEITLTVPDSMVTLSNGLLKTSVKNDNGTRTDTWLQEKQHAPYLTMIAAGNFEVFSENWKGKEVSYYMEPAYAPYAQMIFGKTPEMLDFFSQKLGVEYPWDKYAQIVVRNFVSGAMENTSASVFFDRMNMTPAEYKDETYEDIIAHELFHHWFGDLVTAESWANLPLNESFATYGEYLWLAHKYGLEEADMHALNDVLAYLAKKKNAALDVVRFDYADREQMFDEVSYQKGGRIIHMLRKTVGDEAFFTALNLYLTTHAYRSVEIHDLRLAFEQVTGEDLNWFFNQWFLASGHPELSIKTHYNDTTKEVIVDLAQNQNLEEMPLYRLPMQIDVYSPDKKVERRSVVLTKQNQTFRFPSAEHPTLINVDAEKYLLAYKEESKSLAEYRFQFFHAPLFMDRFEALEGVSEELDQPDAKTVISAALQDKAWVIRLMALGKLEKMAVDEQQQMYQQVCNMALEDDRSYVRASAVLLLRSIYQGFDNDEIFKQLADDDAPSVQHALTLPMA
ncbi:M1 family peptidase [Olivibacter sp. SDN3]|uniref:M1 family metallopeptidase n=1 Tax=Olivibacter sp. SDN3 TaxID=2764720 RepID=UPI001651AC05|nr:M1 family metallopeptidase [Olivibacter sp. SDN3]QNL51431.1 M1 family peptidase [Olivibacter sp. SDN3]